MPRTSVPYEVASIDLIYGRNSVLEALRPGGRVRRLLLADTAHGTVVEDLLERARQAEVPVQAATRQTLDRLVGQDANHQGVVAEVSPFVYATVDEILNLARERDQPPFLVALDSVQDPHNVGSVIRTALAVGAHGLLLPEHRAASISPAVVKVSAGAAEHLLIARVTNLHRTMDSLRPEGLWSYGLAADGAMPVSQVDWCGPILLVIGGEGAGLGRLVRQTCDQTVRIPMSPYAPESLNASVAAAIVLFEVFRQRGNGSPA